MPGLSASADWAVPWCAAAYTGARHRGEAVRDGGLNPFDLVVVYIQLGCSLRSVDSSTQLLLVLRPDLARY
jgi:hypothetical protein